MATGISNSAHTSRNSEISFCHSPSSKSIAKTSTSHQEASGKSRRLFPPQMVINYFLSKNSIRLMGTTGACPLRLNADGFPFIQTGGRIPRRLFFLVFPSSGVNIVPSFEKRHKQPDFFSFVSILAHTWRRNFSSLRSDYFNFGFIPGDFITRTPRLRNNQTCLQDSDFLFQRTVSINNSRHFSDSSETEIESTIFMLGPQVFPI